ncbi:ABC transporter permease [Fulvivirga maritima]|uniref:ABC transporter permease n=1 Tax=Fulvivirga maritima TaxID=2904247 RepID=UPI001F46C7AF|nr:ABC transporter permease [Fulvivirga maritima]UII28053.1 ABC transporter permease [Fulvivirga maritima]
MNKSRPIPPQLAERLLTWFLKDELAEEVLGDLDEKFYSAAAKGSLWWAKLNYWYQVLHYFRPFAIRIFRSNYSIHGIMLQHYFKIFTRNLGKNKAFSLINISGLAIGLTVVITIALWVKDEYSYDKHFNNYDRVAQVMYRQTYEDGIKVGNSTARPLEFILKDEYSGLFKQVVMSTWNREHILSHNNTHVIKHGIYMQEGAEELLSLKMISGNNEGLAEPGNILLSSSAATTLFGNEEAAGKTIQLDDAHEMVIVGVYEDIPSNTSTNFSRLDFIAPWSLYVARSEWVQSVEQVWDQSFQTFVLLNENVSMAQANATVKNVLENRDQHLTDTKAELFLYPMQDWYLQNHWEDGVLDGGRIDFVHLFETIGVFILLLACINFMNLSTARSEKRSKEIGLRKSIGSGRFQIIFQFYMESFLIVFAAFIVSLFAVYQLLPYFNNWTHKHIDLPLNSPSFWLIGGSFIIITSLMAGSYPAIYLSSFNVIKALKGKVRQGAAALITRKSLVITQFSVAIVLIVCTAVIHLQVNFTKDRPTGYNKAGLIQIRLNSDAFKFKYKSLRTQFINSGAVVEMSGSHSPLTDVYSRSSGVDWPGKPTDFKDQFLIVRSSPEYGATVQWKILEGRDFDPDNKANEEAVIINEAAAKYMGLTDPIGQSIGKKRKSPIIGVVKDMVMESPYEQVKPTLYVIDGPYNFYNLRLNPNQSIHKNLSVLENTFKKTLPNVPFNFQFLDDQYAQKFESEERLGQLSGLFTILAIFISCIGLFGLSGYLAEQRTKELGIRKILGASALSLWQLLSKEFAWLTLIACFISAPLSYYFISEWLSTYQYSISMPWWLFAITWVGVLLITLLTVSHQAVKAALVNPVDSLRGE